MQAAKARRRTARRDSGKLLTQARKHMSRELHDTRARLDAMLQQLREELAQLTGELQKTTPNAFRDWGDTRHHLN
jgi:uncharacterized phage infection (PIP) family protein YhgE